MWHCDKPCLSAAGTAKVPGTLLESSQDLYAAVQNFFQAVLGPSNGQRRQLLVGGESYAGKFVPGLGKPRPSCSEDCG